MIMFKIKKIEKTGKFGAYAFGHKRAEYDSIEAAVAAEMPALVQRASGPMAEPVTIEIWPYAPTKK